MIVGLRGIIATKRCQKKRGREFSFGSSLFPQLLFFILNCLLFVLFEDLQKLIENFVFRASLNVKSKRKYLKRIELAEEEHKKMRLDPAVAYSTIFTVSYDCFVLVSIEKS